MAFLTLNNIQKSFGPVQVVHNFNMVIDKGEFVSFLGPSGCGKTTILRMIAGFETPSGGTITIDSKDQGTLKPNQRNIGMVFQAYALFPNMNVNDNVAFGLKVAGAQKSEIDTRVKQMLSLIKLEHLADRFPYQLSGGQQQRVALARALAVKPQVLLLDEPLSALDAKIRVSLREEIRQIQQQLGITTVFVTHDQEEALSISDRIVVMNSGRADQIGTPFEIYNTPATRFVASFVGTLNIIEAKVADPAAGAVTIGNQQVSLKEPIAGMKGGDNISLALRPEAGSIADSARGDTALTGEVVSTSFLGSVIRTKLRIGGDVISFDMFNDPGLTPPAFGSNVTLRFAAKDLLVIRE
ncbi:MULTISPECIES: ABC transporter ATP-binding protein [Ensifer]|jgi:putative spermidine/putrescine transport system ATP-binding protein|uniref:ATP-binding cassette domain-containing protein n=1 Tax=Ensifer canadensis TaxID=555315 RepID=A0AAW4FM77_9HYPH|nr:MULTISPECIES: ABC transporter ATP-binding protein [Ensifer]AHK44918.1 putative ATP-binding component of ABC transporter [Ensifer adhaerens OV14]MDP9632388.1 putative spermidine/putrescine transport system ATP-binding protein [Ensifer adhaerens]KQU73942.1 spermidine/putrescine ABC transporter ATP-binding protein [Ensifer sp. Root31]KQW58396.1 spermidine/putrescine ABC transporter ATP-binding protein [Ensifer sp. Root1252]KQW62355.1 spermidine/putrescine ABC transporter ATP-binding protein [E